MVVGSIVVILVIVVVGSGVTANGLAASSLATVSSLATTELGPHRERPHRPQPWPRREQLCQRCIILGSGPIQGVASPEQPHSREWPCPGNGPLRGATSSSVASSGAALPWEQPHPEWSRPEWPHQEQHHGEQSLRCQGCRPCCRRLFIVRSGLVQGTACPAASFLIPGSSPVQGAASSAAASSGAALSRAAFLGAALSGSSSSSLWKRWIASCEKPIRLYWEASVQLQEEP
ncbi:uncharacterized protein LOC116568682 [Mustela erminea]|uniref:uncharacterized protein LOC116568682 n=1 Tax=Mustela erminea TaxID=36723 RepID=UPI0013870E7E|nr:uncharacterized protein LOC116568682 [Mustela erminea]